MANRWGNTGNGDRLYIFGLQNHCSWWLQPWNKKMLAPWKKSYGQPRQHIKKQRHYFASKGLVKALVFPVVMYGCESWTIKKAECQRTEAFELWCWRRLLRIPWTSRDQTSQSWRKSVLNIHWKDSCWSWNSNTLATWCDELTHYKQPWCWERLRARGERDDRGWNGWMASLMRWTWVWIGSGSWWWTGKPDMLQPMRSQRAGHDWVADLNWTEEQNSLHVSSTGFPGGSGGKESDCSAGDADSIPGLGRFPGEGNGSPLQRSRLENSMDKGAWWDTVYGVTKTWMWLSVHTQWVMIKWLN